jgi:hypothetical protein
MAASKFSLDETKTATEDLTAADEELTGATDDLGKGLLDVEAINKKFAEQTEVATEAQKEAEEASDAYHDSLQAQRDATNDLVAAKTALVGGDIAVRDAQRQAAEAVAALNVLTDEGKVGTEEYGIAQDDAAGAMIAAADAAAQLAIDQAEANGAVVSAKDANQILKEKLEELASTLDPGSPLLLQIQGYIDALNNIPRDVDTRIRATGGGATVGLLPTIGGARQHGGPVGAGEIHPVTEAGSELLHEGGKTYLLSGANGRVQPLNGVNGSAAAGGSGSITLIIEGRPFTAMLAEHDRQVIAALQAGRR